MMWHAAWECVGVHENVAARNKNEEFTNEGLHGYINTSTVQDHAHVLTCGSVNCAGTVVV
jgi:hypothetical protein